MLPALGAMGGVDFLGAIGGMGGMSAAPAQSGASQGNAGGLTVGNFNGGNQTNTMLFVGLGVVAILAMVVVRK